MKNEGGKYQKIKRKMKIIFIVNTQTNEWKEKLKRGKLIKINQMKEKVFNYFLLYSRFWLCRKVSAEQDELVRVIFWMLVSAL